MSVSSASMYLATLLLLTMGLIVLGYTMGVKANYSREKLSTYECGFEPMSSSRQAFCLRFFILAIIFLVFDVEIALLIPYLLSVGVGMGWSVRVLVYSFVLILVVGLIHEFNEGSLDWML
uniref:NADH-ubiquinone oxidoreductase chain 3 n=1 Tax=Semele scabra TaxID=1125679 RepID=J3JR30_9BIVA|nr:NADH dehydrogenase subunit 3 [Semele scabra]AEV94305.1 NADH dehydrogenase subunit 3 [Semele scabra]